MPLNSEIDYALAHPQRDTQLAVLLDGPQCQLLSCNGAQQVALGEVWPLVRQLGLCANQLDLARKTRVPQTSGNGITGRAAADDQGSGRFPSSSRKRSSDQAR